MKMKILTVAVFCAYIVAVFSKGFNRTMSGQVTGKALPPRIVHCPEITRKLSTLLIIDSLGVFESYGVLLGRKRIAFPESEWKEDARMEAYVYCFIKWGRPLGLMSVFLKERIPEEKRLYLAEGIVEVELDEKVPENCWPPGEQRYTKCATASEMERGDPVYAITLDQEQKDTLEKPYALADFIENKYVKIRRRTDIPPPAPTFIAGEPLFHNEKIAGMFVPEISDEEEGVAKKMIYVLFRKQSIGQSSN